MLRSIWQILRGAYSQRRSGIDKTNIEHLRADLRFRLAMVEYAYYGKSGKRVTRCLAELKSALGEKGAHRYLRALDPDLREQFVERFQGMRRSDRPVADKVPGRQTGSDSLAVLASLNRSDSRNPLFSNVIPINYATRKSKGPDDDPSPGNRPEVSRRHRSADSGE